MQTLPAFGCRVALDEILGEDGNVSLTLAQRRQLETRDIQTVEKVGAEAIVGNRCLQRRVGSSNDASCKRALFRSAEPAKAPILDDTKQFSLQLERKLRNFVEEHCPSAGDFEQAALERPRIRERARLMSEQLAFQQRFGDRGAIDSYERLGRALTRGVDATREQLLTRARFADQQDGHAATCGYLGC